METRTSGRRKMTGQISTISSNRLDREFLALNMEEQAITVCITGEVAKASEKPDAKLPIEVLVFPSDHDESTPSERTRAAYEARAIEAFRRKAVQEHVRKELLERLRKMGPTKISFKIIEGKRVRVKIT